MANWVSALDLEVYVTELTALASVGRPRVVSSEALAGSVVEAVLARSGTVLVALLIMCFHFQEWRCSFRALGARSEFDSSVKTMSS